MSRLGTIARRTLLIGSAAILGGVAFGTCAYQRPYPDPLKPGDGAKALIPYVLIDATGVIIIAPRAEMGQGVHTTLAAMVAEEMDLDWEQVRVIHGPASHACFSAAMLQEAAPFPPTDQSWIAETVRGFMQIPVKFLGIQLTGGSMSTPDALDKMRAAGPVARAALLAAAARRSGLAEAALKTEGGAVILPDGTAIPYTDLAAEAASVNLPDTPPLRDPSQWKLLGKPLPRTDMVAKCTRTAMFSGDLRLPGMVFATIRANLQLYAPTKSFDGAGALKLPGVTDVPEIDNGVAVVAYSTRAASKGDETLTID